MLRIFFFQAWEYAENILFFRPENMPENILFSGLRPRWWRRVTNGRWGDKAYRKISFASLRSLTPSSCWLHHISPTSIYRLYVNSEDFELCRQVEVKEHHRAENRANGAARSEFFFVLSLSGGFEEKDIAVSWWEVLEFWTTKIFLVGELLRVGGAGLGINILPRGGRYFSCQPTCRGQQ